MPTLVFSVTLLVPSCPLAHGRKWSHQRWPNQRTEPPPPDGDSVSTLQDSADRGLADYEHIAAEILVQGPILL